MTTLRQKGISLMELIIATTLFSIAATAAYALIVSSGLMISDQEMSTRAEQYCFSTLEEQMDRPFDELQPNTSEDLPMKALSGQELHSRVTISAVPGVDSAQLVEVEVEATWTARGKNGVRRASGLVANVNR